MHSYHNFIIVSFQGLLHYLVGFNEVSCSVRCVLHLLSTLAARLLSLVYCSAGKLLAYHGSEANCMHKIVLVNVH